MKTSKTDNLSGGIPIKPSRFRLPFKQKPVFPPRDSGASLGSPSKDGGRVTPTSPSRNNPGLFSLGRKLGFKPSTPTLRKSVSFSAPKTLHQNQQNQQNMDWKKKISQDHTDLAYREAVSRLRAILSPRPTPKAGTPTTTNPSSPVGIKRPLLNLNNNLNNQLPSRLSYPYQYQFVNAGTNNPPETAGGVGKLEREDDLFGFIAKQNEYIAQLEKETRYSREELASLLEKVRDVIAENEELHQKQKTDILTSMISQLNEKTAGTGGGGEQSGDKGNIMNMNTSSVILESRVAELEAQLSQARRNLRIAQEEILEMRKGNIHGTGGSGSHGGTDGGTGMVGGNMYAHCDLHRAEIDTLNKEKADLIDTMQKMKQMVSELRDRESEAAKKVKNSLEVVEQMQVEKAQSDMESRRLKEELDRQQLRIRDMIQDHSRRLHDEKLQVERKYKQELDQLNNEMNIELDSLTKARLDLERQKRVEADLRRELQQKVCSIEELRNEMQLKIGHMQAELASVIAQKGAVEEELINSRLNAEKADRDARQDASRLQAEINGLRKRLEQSDADLVSSQEVIVRLNETISHLQRETSLAKIRLESHIAENPELADADVVTIIQNMEEKHSRDMQELEQLIQQQNGLLDKLRGECRSLTDKLEESAKQYKKERTILEAERDKHAHTGKVAQEKCVELEQRVNFFSSSHEQMTTRLQKLEEDDKNRSARIFQLLTKQSGLLRENQNLQNEVATLKSKVGQGNGRSVV